MPDLDLENASVLFIIAPGFNEPQLFQVMRIIENRGVNITLAAETQETVVNRIPIIPDYSFEEIAVKDYDAIILVNYRHKIRKKEELKTILMEFNTEKKLICSIGNSKDLLKEANLLKEPLSENILLAKSDDIELFSNHITEKLLELTLD